MSTNGQGCCTMAQLCSQGQSQDIVRGSFASSLTESIAIYI